MPFEAATRKGTVDLAWSRVALLPRFDAKPASDIAACGPPWCIDRNTITEIDAKPQMARACWH